MNDHLGNVLDRKTGATLGKDRSIVILLAAVILVSITGLYYTEYGNDRIKNNLQLSTAKIINVELVDKYNRQSVEFELEGDTFRKNREDLKYGLFIKLKGVTVPVVFDSTDHSYNRLLISPDDYKKYGVAYPDSLQWVKDFFKE